MSAYNIVVNDVQKTENKVLCLARIDNYRNMLKRVSVGQSISTEPIRINFRDSIGASRWNILFYPRGQYIYSSKNSDILASGRVSIYLKMICCENEEKSVDMTIKFFIKSPYFEMKDKFAYTKCANFLYRNLNQRWIGLDLLSMEELYSNQYQNYFVNDSLTIGCELNVTKSRPYVPRLRSTICSKEYRDRSNAYAEKDDVKGQKNMVCRSTSPAIQKQVTEENPNKHFFGHNQINGPNKKVSSGSQTWRQKLLQSCNEKMENNLRSREPATRIGLQSSTGDAGCVCLRLYQTEFQTLFKWNVFSQSSSYCVKDTISFFERCSISRD